MKAIFQINPVPASRARVTRWSTYFPKRYTQFKKDMEIILGNIHVIPSKSLIYAQIDFFIAIPGSWSKKKKKSKEGQYADNNADIDNYCKAILDSLEGKYFENDKQIVMIRARKFYSNEPRIIYKQRNIDGQRGDECTIG